MKSNITFTELDLTMVTDMAIRLFREERSPVLLNESQFRAMCFAKATLGVLISKGNTELLEIEFPKERSTESVFED